MKHKVYLAGWTGEIYYRAYCLKFGQEVELYDPLKDVEKSILGMETQIAYQKVMEFTDEQIEKIITLDKASIQTCDFLVAYIKKPTFGTTMEILHAFNHKVPVYVINPGLTFEYDIWLKYHSMRMFETIDSCFDCIINQNCYKGATM